MGVYQDLKQGVPQQTQIMDDFGVGELDLDADVAALNGVAGSSEDLFGVANDKFSDLSKIARDAAALASESSTTRRKFDAVPKDKADSPRPADTRESAAAAESPQTVMKSDDVQLTDTAVITKEMEIVGNVSSTGNMNLFGSVVGDIEILGKLKITGTIRGNTSAAEVYAESARIDGEIRGDEIVRIGENTVVIGSIFSASAVIAGAVKGDIDVKGPVVLNESAVVMGNIKSKSVQINSGAVIEGMCSQCYSDVSLKEFFEKRENKIDNIKEDKGDKESANSREREKKNNGKEEEPKEEG